MKQTIQQYIANADTESALKACQDYSEETKNSDMETQLIMLSARYSVVLRKEEARTEDPEELQRELNRIHQSLLSIAETLPDNPSGDTKTALAKPKGITENGLKQQLFFLILIAKALILAWLTFHYSTNGIDSQEFAAGFGLLLPVFASYTGLMFQEFLSRRHIVSSRKSPLVKPSVQWTIYGIITAYTFALLIVVYLRTAYGNVSLATGFTAVETLFGVYISKIITTFFQKKNTGF